MNRPAVEKLLEHLKEQQKTKAAARFNMKFFGVPVSYADEGVLEEPECHTQACLAGEGVLANGAGYIQKTGGIMLNDESRYGRDIERAAQDVLGLSSYESDRLFFFKRWTDDEENGWPDGFEDAYEEATTPTARLQVAIDRVQHFLDTDGKE